MPTGLCACCSKYGLSSLARRFVYLYEQSFWCGPSMPWKDAADKAISLFDEVSCRVLDL